MRSLGKLSRVTLCHRCYLIYVMEEQTDGINVSHNRKVPILTFADDIVLLGEDEREAQHQVHTLRKYLKGLGMTISGEKSQTFQLVDKKDTWFVQDPKVRLNETLIPEIDPNEAFRYLGTKMWPWKVIHRGIILPEILSVVRNVRKISLKPCQKIELITNYIFPRYIYYLLINPPSDSALKLLDSEVRPYLVWCLR